MNLPAVHSAPQPSPAASTDLGNIPQIATGLYGASPEFRRYFHRGWIDAQNGVPWAVDYNYMSDIDQMAYEQGRLLVREAIAEGFPLHVWHGDKATCGQVDWLYHLVCTKLGRNISPPEWEAVT